jgi:hypothetical protein
MKVQNSEKAQPRPKRRASISTKIRSELERAIVRACVSSWTSDTYWRRVRGIRDNLSAELRSRARLKSLAGRYGRKPTLFIEKVRGLKLASNAYEGPTTKALRSSKFPKTRAQLGALVRLIKLNPDMVTHPYFYPPMTAERVVELAKPLTWDIGGRPATRLLDKAQEFLKQYPRSPSRMHSVCIRLCQLARAGDVDPGKEYPEILQYTGPHEGKPQLGMNEQKSLRHRISSALGMRKSRQTSS